ncbi:energy-coupling factor transporter ATPase [Peptoniphilus gorbachii]|uniref:Energy-coupling factor transport system ATP-binding protein n=1 Tax=Peptoniphilus gorbachii TaxID=411567 RepID=A0ABS2MI47_9FIRM|nr:energy-coupling factor transporter ATPase [Peptoniphilus gorbachii]MBM7549699.1 energy-coupling factor transport system ATP-binding protein [Peptoniphilus gorbachii]MDU6783809.1 energy-coupling factor transporter ATPase [Peptoniphilus harei]MDU7115533.1 energy-coupling factor transporter ATPase [Peptoniphilus harei]
MISIKNLSFKYDYEDENAKQILKDIDLEIKEGEFLALLGHNGSGKSTLAKLINGLLIPGEGDVLVDGMNTKNEEEIWDIRRNAGMVFQNPDNQLVATIVEDEVAFGPENLGIEPAEIRKRVDKALEDVGMTDYKKNAPHLLSGGQKQRVAIAGILAMSPKYIILDEPTAMLDPSGRREVIDTLVKLNKEENKTIILITHYMEEAAISDRVVVMEDGNIVLSGKPREVFSQVEEIKKLGLDVPQVTELAHELKKDGIEISTEVLNIEEMVKEICHL